MPFGMVEENHDKIDYIVNPAYGRKHANPQKWGQT